MNRTMAGIFSVVCFYIFFFLSSLGLQGCFLDQSNDAGMVNSPPVGSTPATVFVASDTTAAGQTISWKAGDPAKSALAGQWKVTVPAGAAALAVDITVKAATVMTQPPSGTLLSGAVEVSSTGVTLAKPIEMSLDFSVPGLPPGALGRLVTMVRYDAIAQTLEMVTGSYSSEGLRTLYGSASSFSFFSGFLTPAGVWKVFTLRGERTSEGAVLAEIGGSSLVSQPVGRWSAAISTGGTFNLLRKTQTAYQASGSFDFTQADETMAGTFDGTFNLTTAGGTGTWKALGGASGTWRALHCGRPDLVTHASAAATTVDGFMGAIETRTPGDAMALVSDGVAKASPVAYDPEYSGKEGLRSLLTSWTDTRDYSGLAYKKQFAQDADGRVTAAVAITYPRHGGLWLLGLTSEAGVWRISSFDF